MLLQGLQTVQDDLPRRSDPAAKGGQTGFDALVAQGQAGAAQPGHGPVTDTSQMHFFQIPDQENAQYIEDLTQPIAFGVEENGPLRPAASLPVPPADQQKPGWCARPLARTKMVRRRGLTLCSLLRP